MDADLSGVIPDVEAITGQFFANRKPKAANKAAGDAEVTARLWRVSADLVGLTGPFLGTTATHSHTSHRSGQNRRWRHWIGSHLVRPRRSGHDSHHHAACSGGPRSA